MRHFARIAAGIAGVLVCYIVARADGPVPAANPYTTIAARNAFGLEPIPKPPVFLPPEEPRPKVVPKGIMTILGRPQVLFTMAMLQNSPGHQTSESWYVLTEGERADGVEVVRIDITTGTVTFNNHGIVEQIPLPDAPARRAQ